MADIKQSSSSFPLKQFIQRKSSTYQRIDRHYTTVDTLGSNTCVANSIIKSHDPYMPNMHARELSSKRHSQLTVDSNKQTRPFYNQKNHYSTSHLPPLSPPPLSPTNLSFARSSKPSWREITRSNTYQTASSISSSSSSSDDDDEPLGIYLKGSLLNDQSDEDDDDLVPIATLSISRNTSQHLSAAEKYKAKVRARLNMTS